MSTPLPTPDTVNLKPPTLEETKNNAAGMLSAAAPEGGPTDFQYLLIEATVGALTGHRIDTRSLPTIDAKTAAENLAYRDAGYRMRMVHMMVLNALVLQPIPPEVSKERACSKPFLASFLSMA